MKTIEEEYPVQDMESVRQWLRREIARSEACAAHQYGRDQELSDGLSKQAETLKQYLRSVRQ